MSRFLLEPQLVLALTITDHEQHRRAARWFADGAEVALSPSVEIGVLRVLVRLGESVGTAQAVLRQWRDHPRVAWWADDLAYGTAELSALRDLRHLTGLCLAALADAHGGRLATLDPALAALRPGSIELIPAH